MDSGTLALWGVGALWVLFAAWVWISQKHMDVSCKIHGLLRQMLDSLCEKHNRLGEDYEATQSHVKSLFAMGEALEDGFRENSDRLDELEKRIAGVEALLVSTVGQETEDFCRQMDALMDRMEKPEEKPEQKERLTLSKEYCGKYSKKGAK